MCQLILLLLQLIVLNEKENYKTHFSVHYTDNINRIGIFIKRNLVYKVDYVIISIMFRGVLERDGLIL